MFSTLALTQVRASVLTRPSNHASFLLFLGEHQHELLDFVAAKFHEEMGVFKLLVSFGVPTFFESVCSNIKC